MSSLPNFFVVGAVKAGTTAFHHLLNQHQEIYMSPIKEPNFFAQSDLKPHLYVDQYRRSVSFNLDKYLRGSMQKTVHIADVKTWEDYRSLFKNVSAETAIGEGSNSYLFCPSSAELIAQRFPDAKIIIILRNPADRAWSHYLMNQKLGHQVLPDFLEEIAKDRAIQPRGWGITANYFELGLYDEQINRFLAVFPKAQIKILLYEDFVRDPSHTFSKVCEFLGVSAVLANFENTHKNVGAVPRWPAIYRALQRSGIFYSIKRRLPTSMKDLLQNIILKRRNLPRLGESERHALLKLYTPSIRSLSFILGRNIDHWLN
jgi:hypothetical protein